MKKQNYKCMFAAIWQRIQRTYFIANDRIQININNKYEIVRLKSNAF